MTRSRSRNRSKKFVLRMILICSMLCSTFLSQEIVYESVSSFMTTTKINKQYICVYFFATNASKKFTSELIAIKEETYDVSVENSMCHQRVSISVNR